MNRRGFFKSVSVGIAGLLGLSARESYLTYRGVTLKRPHVGQDVRLVSWPDKNVLKAVGTGTVTAEVFHPKVLNEHYRPELQLYKVDFGLYNLECYAQELVPV